MVVVSFIFTVLSICFIHSSYKVSYPVLSMETLLIGILICLLLWIGFRVWIQIKPILWANVLGNLCFSIISGACFVFSFFCLFSVMLLETKDFPGDIDLGLVIIGKDTMYMKALYVQKCWESCSQTLIDYIYLRYGETVEYKRVPRILLEKLMGMETMEEIHTEIEEFFNKKKMEYIKSRDTWYFQFKQLISNPFVPFAFICAILLIVLLSNFALFNMITQLTNDAEDLRTTVANDFNSLGNQYTRVNNKVNEFCNKVNELVAAVNTSNDSVMPTYRISELHGTVTNHRKWLEQISTLVDGHTKSLGMHRHIFVQMPEAKAIIDKISADAVYELQRSTIAKRVDTLASLVQQVQDAKAQSSKE